MCADTGKVQFVCLRAAHHRRWATGERLCANLGCAAYCPAGDIGDHEWMPTATDLLGLTRLGYIRPRDEADLAAEDERERRDDAVPVLIRT